MLTPAAAESMIKKAMKTPVTWYKFENVIWIFAFPNSSRWWFKTLQYHKFWPWYLDLFLDTGVFSSYSCAKIHRAFWMSINLWEQNFFWLTLGFVEPNLRTDSINSGPGATQSNLMIAPLNYYAVHTMLSVNTSVPLLTLWTKWICLHFSKGNWCKKWGYSFLNNGGGSCLQFLVL